MLSKGNESLKSRRTNSGRNRKKNREIDTMGGRHIWIVRGETYPPLRPIKKKAESEKCRKCTQGERLVDSVQECLNRMDGVVKNLEKTINDSNLVRSKLNMSIDFSKMVSFRFSANFFNTVYLYHPDFLFH